MGLEIDESQHPRITVRWTGAISDQEMRAGLEALDRWIALGVPFALLVDARGGWPFSAEQRTMVTDHMRANRVASDRLLIQAFVIDNALVRALYYAVSWAMQLPFPSKAFADLEPAQAWVDAQLEAKARQARSDAA